MRNQCTVKAPAKINIHLQVGPKRDDGLHDIISIFQMVSLYDKITMRSLKTDNDCRILGNFDCNVKDNLIFKAWKAYCTKAGKEFGIEVSVEKNIPSFAGLGGGSSNAAFTLKAMNYIFSCFNKKELFKIASEIGSDVPFFLSENTAAIVEGCGNHITPLELPKKVSLVLITPSIKISTKSAYSWIDKSKRTTDCLCKKEELIRVYYGDLKEYNYFRNDFTDVLESRFETFSKLKMLLKDFGSCYTNITGSGSAIFGLFENTKQAKIAINRLKTELISAQHLNLLDRLPNGILQ